MSDPQQQTSNDYGIWVEPVEGKVEAFCGDTLIASSTNARVMHETRLKPTVYFPRQDVCGSLVANPDHRTFCPFKGTASYFNLQLDDVERTNAAWMYEKTLPEGRGVEGHIAFMPNVQTRLELQNGEIEPTPSGNIAGPTIDWIMRGAWLCKTPEELTATVAAKLLADGVAISRMSVMIWSLHPMIAGRFYVWQKDTGKVESFNPSYDIHEHPSFINSPLRHVSQGLGGVRQRLDGSPIEFNFPIIEDLKDAGATDYVAMPLPFSNGQINVLTLSCDHPKGFTTANLGLVFECSSVISRYYEVFALKENAEALLETYLGKRTGTRVLGGEIRRGDGDDIEAAILFCDLRASTRLEEDLGRGPYINLLNQFFEAVTGIINENDGEVLKFIGDAVLAIFPVTSDQPEACQRALNSAMSIVDQLCGEDAENWAEEVDCAIGIDFGDVTYGNIGSRERLDFTVIGQAANIAARLGDFGKLHDHRIVVTEKVISDDSPVIPLGEVSLHNVGQPVRSFAWEPSVPTSS